MLGAAGHARHRRVDQRVGQIELGLAHLRGALLLRRRRGLRRRKRVVVFLAADGAIFRQGLQPLLLALRLLGARPVLLGLTSGLRQRDLERRTVDLEQRRAGADRVALLVELLLEDARDARADLDLLRAFGLSHGIEDDRHALRGDLPHRDADRGRRRRRAGGRRARLLAASAERERDGDGRNSRRDDTAPRTDARKNTIAGGPGTGDRRHRTCIPDAAMCDVIRHSIQPTGPLPRSLPDTRERVPASRKLRLDPIDRASPARLAPVLSRPGVPGIAAVGRATPVRAAIGKSTVRLRPIGVDPGAGTRARP